MSLVPWWLLADTLTPLDMEPLAEVPGNKKVQLVVECPLPWCYELRLYDHLVPVPAAASLLDVLQAAAALEPRDFRYVGVTLWWPRVLQLCPVPGSLRLPAHSSHGSSSVPHQQCWGRTLGPLTPLSHPRFHTQDTPQGPFLTEVLGLEARREKRNYWQILTAPNTPLQMGEWWVGVPGEVAGVPRSPVAAVSPQTVVPLPTGIADYRPQDGETLILRLSEW